MFQYHFFFHPDTQTEYNLIEHLALELLIALVLIEGFSYNDNNVQSVHLISNAL